MRGVGHFRRNQNFQQCGCVTDAARDRDECFRDNGMLFRQHGKAVTDAVEFLNFVQKCKCRHCVPDFLKAQE